MKGRNSGIRLALWGLLGIALAVALAVGASGSSGPETATQRASALDAQLRCPSCDDLSVADSSAASAVAIRQLVLTDTEAGEPSSEIVSYLQSRYPGIVLRPSASGIEGLVWYAPLAGFAIALVVIASVFWRRHNARATRTPAEEDRRLVSEALGATKTGAQL